jgi:hypothetical protein
MNITSQETENQDRINMMVAEQISEECDVETFEFPFNHVFRSCPFKAKWYQMCYFFNCNIGSHCDTGCIYAFPTFLTLNGCFLSLHGTIHLVFVVETQYVSFVAENEFM